MLMKEKAYLLNKDLEIIYTIYIDIQPKDTTITIRDDKLSSLSLKINITNIIYTKNNSLFDYTQYVYYNNDFYKILRITKYRNYCTLEVYKCDNVQNELLQPVETLAGKTYMLEVVK